VSKDIASGERALAKALVAADPVAALRRAAEAGDLPPGWTERVGSPDEDGLRLTALLVAKLRFERLMRGSRRAEDWFDHDPAGFAEAFRRYHAEVLPTEFMPAGEARLFAEWSELEP
jgi:hypothetical protein